MGNLEMFLSEKIKNSSPSTAKYYTDFYKRVSSLFPTDKEPAQFEKDDFVCILTKLNARTVATFRTDKCNIIEYFKWLANRGEMTEEQIVECSNISYDDIDDSDSHRIYYFKNFNDLYSCLEDAISYKRISTEESDEYNAVRCAVYLAWYGFTLEEIVNVLKADVNEKYLIVYKGKDKVPVQISPKAMQYISKYRNSISYTSAKFGRLVEISYKKSEYLFRSYKNEKIPKTSINTMLAAISEHHKDVGKKFAHGKIHQSGMFCRARIDEINNGKLNADDQERILRLFGYDEKKMSKDYARIKSNALWVDYQKYKETLSIQAE